MKSPKSSHIYNTGNTRIDLIPYSLKFIHPFRLAIGSRNETSLVILRIQEGKETFFGEASLPPYLRENQASVMRFIRELDWGKLLHADLNESTHTFSELPNSNAPASAAVSMAIYDRYSRRSEQPLWEFCRLPNPNFSETSLTIGISMGAEFDKKLEEAKPFQRIKLKLGGSHDQEMLAYFKRKTSKEFCADANQAWTNRDLAARYCELLQKANCRFLEQPFPVGNEEDAHWLRQRVSLPIIGDESIQNMRDLHDFQSCFDGVNVKLMKCGGIAQAIQLLNATRELGKMPILGAMAESQCAVSAASHLAALADWVDLDGPLLSANDPFEGIGYRDGKIILSEKNGVGIRLKESEPGFE